MKLTFALFLLSTAFCKAEPDKNSSSSHGLRKISSQLSVTRNFLKNLHLYIRGCNSRSWSSCCDFWDGRYWWQWLSYLWYWAVPKSKWCFIYWISLWRFGLRLFWKLFVLHWLHLWYSTTVLRYAFVKQFLRFFKAVGSFTKRKNKKDSSYFILLIFPPTWKISDFSKL